MQRELKRKAYEAASPAITNNPTKTGKKARISKAGTAAQHPEGYQRAPRIWGQATSDASNILEASDRATVDSSDDEGAAADVAALLTQSKGQVHSENSSPPPRVVSQDPHPGSNGKASERQASAEPLQVAEMDGDDSDHDSAPEEVDYSNGRPTVDEESEAAMDLPDQTSDSSKAHRRHDQMRPSCNAWTTQGTCKFGKQCRYEHDPSKRGKVRHEPRQAAKNPFERGDLIGKLVHHQIRHEVSDLTQVIDFLARNDWLRHVELYPGHKAELDGRINEVSS